jgi:hypothetical protein
VSCKLCDTARCCQCFNVTCSLVSVCQKSCASIHDVGLPSKWVPTMAPTMHGPVILSSLSVWVASFPPTDMHISAAFFSVIFLVKKSISDCVVFSLLARHPAEVRRQFIDRAVLLLERGAPGSRAPRSRGARLSGQTRTVCRRVRDSVPAGQNCVRAHIGEARVRGGSGGRHTFDSLLYC